MGKKTCASKKLQRLETIVDQLDGESSSSMRAELFEEGMELLRNASKG